MLIQTLVETQETVADFQLTSNSLLDDNDSEASSDDCQVIGEETVENSDSKPKFKEYIPGDCSSNDDVDGLVPYVDTDEESSQSACTNSSLQAEDPLEHHKQPVSESELRDLQGKTFALATNKKIGWAVKRFCDWRKGRISKGLGGLQIESSDILDPDCESRLLEKHNLFVSE